CIASNDQIGRAAGGKAPRTVQRALDELERLGEIRRIMDPSGKHRLRIEGRQICHTLPAATPPPVHGGATDLSHGGATDLSPDPELVEREQERYNVPSLDSLEDEDKTPSAEAPGSPRTDDDVKPEETPTLSLPTLPAGSQALPCTDLVKR